MLKHPRLERFGVLVLFGYVLVCGRLVKGLEEKKIDFLSWSYSRVSPPVFHLRLLNIKKCAI